MITGSLLTSSWSWSSVIELSSFSRYFCVSRFSVLMLYIYIYIYIDREREREGEKINM